MNAENARETPYLYARLLELEGTHPRDVGAWAVTNERVLYMEGLPAFIEDRMVRDAADGTIGATPAALHTAYRLTRSRYYCRVRSADDAARLLARGSRDHLAKVSLHVFPSWVNPTDGIIPMPAAGEPPAPETHAVTLLAATPHPNSQAVATERPTHFIFQNTWGPDWGRDWMGAFPFAYYDQYGFEQWARYSTSDLLEFRDRRLGAGRGRWQARDEFGRQVYAFEAGDPARERLGWAFVVHTGEALEVEELYVAPWARRQGIGGWLVDRVTELARANSMPVRVWVSFADVASQSPGTVAALPKLARRLGVSFHKSTVRWAGYYAASERLGSPGPVEPEYMPSRPKAALGALAAFALTLSTGQPGSGNSGTPVPAVEAGGTALATPTLGSAEWRDLNDRRGALIDKKYDVGLSPAEQAELARLQLAARASVEAAHPSAPLAAPAMQVVVDAGASRR